MSSMLATKRRCQRAGCKEYTWIPSGIKFKMILCKDCRDSDWSNDNVRNAIGEQSDDARRE